MLRLANSEYLYGLLVIPVLVLIFLWLLFWKKRTLKKFGDPHLVKKLFTEASSVKPVLKFGLFALAMAFLVVGIADPQIGTKLEEVKHEGIDLIIALDVSNSMKAEDIKPNRLDRSKQAISKLIDNLQGDRIGIIVFAGQAYVQLPVTTDYGAAKLFLSTISNDLVPTQGTAIGAAISLAESSFPPDPASSKALIIITDGENHEDNAISIAKKAKKTGIIVHTIGMGSPAGAPIPEGNDSQGYLKDKEGNTVLTKLNEELLQKIASAGDGLYIRASNSEDGLRTIVSEINKMQKKNYGTKMYTDYEDRFQFFLGIALLLLIIEVFISERRSVWLSKINLFK